MKNYILFPLAAGAVLAAGLAPQARGAAGKASVAVIADVNGNVRWASDRKGRPDLLDELYEGDKLRAPKGTRVVLVYFEGCRKETITGAATADIGRAASKVIGQVKAGQTKCERRKAVLPADSGRTAQGLIVASLPPGSGGGSDDVLSESAARDSGSLGGAPAGSLTGRASAPRGEARGKSLGAAGNSPNTNAPALAMTSSPASRAEKADLAETGTARPDTRRADYLRAIKRSPRDMSAKLAYAAYLENNGELEEALAQYKQVLAERPRSAALRKRCGELEAKIRSAGR